MYDIVFCQMYGATGGIKQTGMHNRHENGVSARVALCAHPTHTRNLCVRFGIFTVVSMMLFWVLEPCNFVGRW
jgi:hypothetical protein